MSQLFDKVKGTITSFNASSITDTNANFKVDYYKGWWVVIDNVDYKIESNTTNSLTFWNSIPSNLPYSIQFISRTSINDFESDASDSFKIPDDIIDKKYNQANTDINNKALIYLRGLYSDTFIPLENILNLTVLQSSFIYYTLSKIYQDLIIDRESFEAFKAYNMYEKSYKDNIADALNLLQVDLNQDGVANTEELNKSASSVHYFIR